jgi:phage terminase large subunit
MDDTSSQDQIKFVLKRSEAAYDRRLDYIAKLKEKKLYANEMERCRLDIVHWTNQWVWTFDPRLASMGAPSSCPFDLFPRQAEFLRWLAKKEAEQKGGLCEKSRETGVTWLCCDHAIHAWLFREGVKISFGSRKQDLVDKKGDPDSIFEKIRHIWRTLPPWMMPEGFSEREHDNFCKLINPANGSTITGEAGDEIGRGGRSTMVFIDECAFLEHPQTVDSALSMNTNVRIDVSTPNGPGNAFANKRFGGTVEVFHFHWRSDPRKTQAWYDEFLRLNGPVRTAQELDIDYTASVEGITIPAAWVRAAISLDLPRSGLQVAGLDIATGGSNETVFCPRHGPVVDQLICWSKQNTTETAWRAQREMDAIRGKCLYYDAIGVGEGVKGTFFTSEQPLRFTAKAVISGEAPTDRLWDDGKTSKQKFINVRAEMWWSVRTRFERTFDYVTKGITYPLEDLISIPNDPKLIAQLSNVLHYTKENGKIAIESKADMAKRGVASPDRADALIMAFYPIGAFVVPEPISQQRINPYATRDSSAHRRNILGRGEGGGR